MKRDADQLRNAIQRNLSGLRMTDTQRRNIRMQTKGGKQMKKKTPWAIVLALLIILIFTATAYAISNWDQIKAYLGSVRRLADQTQGWPLEDRLQLVELMHEAGLVDDEEAYQQLHRENLSEQEKIMLSDQIIENRYGEGWQWLDTEIIEDVEWPVEKRYESLESLIEYEKWTDQQEKEREQDDEGPTYHLLAEEEARQVFQKELIALFGFTEDSYFDQQFAIHHWTDERIWECSYTLTDDHPGWHIPTVGDQLSRYTEEMTVMDYIKRHFIPDYLREKAADQDSIEITMTMDDWGRDMRWRTLDMESAMVEHMVSDLTEIYSFTPDSVELERIQVRFDLDSRVWTAAYTVDAEHPGVFNNIPGEHEADTVYESLCNAYGEQSVFTLTCQKTFLNRSVNEDPQLPYDEGFIGERQAIQAARQAILDKYGCWEEALDEMSASAQWTRNDGQDEYYVEFTGYDLFSENYARLWNYAARVDAKTGAIAAAVSREEWEPMTGQKLIVDDSNREYVRRDQLYRALYLAAGETENELENRHLYMRDDHMMFQEWSLEERAAYSRAVKPRIDQFLAAHPEDRDFYLNAGAHTIVGMYIATTRHEYGLPDEGTITQEDAFSLACEAIHKEYGVDAQKLKESLVYTYYDVTDPQHPLWKFDMNLQPTDENTEFPLRCFAAIDAYTGEAVILRTNDKQWRGWDFM